MFTIIMEKLSKIKKLYFKQRSVSFNHRHYVEENDYETEYNSLDGLNDFYGWILDSYKSKVRDSIIGDPRKLYFNFNLDKFNYNISVIEEKDTDDLKKYSFERDSNLIYWQISEDFKNFIK